MPRLTNGETASDADRSGPSNDTGFSDNYELRERRLRKTNGALEFVYQALNLADLGETLSCLHRHTCQEGNPILGKHPSDAKLIGFKALAGLIHFVIYDTYKDRHSRFIFDFECISIGVESVVVGLNLRHSF